MTLRNWTDPRDGRHWRVRQTGRPTVLVFSSEDDLFSVVIDFNDRLENRHEGSLLSVSHSAMTTGVVGLEQQIKTEPSSGGSRGSMTYSTSPSSILATQV